jgi:hypothetical protein
VLAPHHRESVRAGTFVGFVEDISGPKIHISVQEAYYADLLGVKGLGRKADNYQPQMMWDLPQNWYVCEQLAR